MTTLDRLVGRVLLWTLLALVVVCVWKATT